jgi:hypothetical protein
MSTQLSPSSGNLNFPMLITGVPIGDGLYAQSLLPVHTIGSRYISQDGRVFRYGKAYTECQSGYGAYNNAICNISVVLPSTPATLAAGTKQVKFTIASGDGFAGDGVIAKDELVGAYAIIGNDTEDPDFRLIVANTAVASSGGTTLCTLDGPTVGTWTGASSYAEIVLNPYAHLTGGATTALGARASVMGIPTVNLTALYHGFIQTWGPCWITPPTVGATAPGYTDNDREVYFVANGTVVGAASGTTIESGFQHAGFVMDKSDTSTAGPPLIMLQISI